MNLPFFLAGPQTTRRSAPLAQLSASRCDRIGAHSAQRPANCLSCCKLSGISTVFAGPAPAADLHARSSYETFDNIERINSLLSFVFTFCGTFFDNKFLGIHRHVPLEKNLTPTRVGSLARSITMPLDFRGSSVISTMSPMQKSHFGTAARTCCYSSSASLDLRRSQVRPLLHWFCFACAMTMKVTLL